MWFLHSWRGVELLKTAYFNGILNFMLKNGIKFVWLRVPCIWIFHVFLRIHEKHIQGIFLSFLALETNTILNHLKGVLHGSEEIVIDRMLRISGVGNI